MCSKFCHIGLLIILNSCFNVCLSVDIGHAEHIMVEKDELILKAKNIAEKEGMNTKDCNTKIVYEKNFTIVGFHPKNRFQFGGGGRVYFRKENEKYIYQEIEFWQ